MSDEELDDLIKATENELMALQHLKERAKISNELWNEMIDVRLDDFKALTEERKRRKK
ncbi:MAG: hypothetical protein K6F78_06075 [Bacteroidaceae bacterium]|nr:hypothetical protein [Bacteroidaceae bacterium]